MKRIYKILIAIPVTIVVLLIAARITGGLQFYKVPTPSNEPTVRIGDYLITTNLKSAKPYNFIVYTNKYIDSVTATFMGGKPGSQYLKRLCGMPGDIIEMKNAILFVNRKNFDEELNLNQQYKISKKEAALIEEEDQLQDGSSLLPTPDNDSVLVIFGMTLIKKYQSSIKFKPFISNDTSASGPFKWYEKNPGWTIDNFGPFTIPANCYFVLGDNRHNSLDSRFTGFVKKEDIKGVVLNK